MALTPHDTAIWHTCHLNELVDTRRLGEWAPVPRTFATLFQGERVLTVGPFRLLTYSAVGDGSYVQDNSYFFATGRYGAALTVGAAVGQAAGNAARRSRAAGDATPRWRAADSGQVYISTEGFYLTSRRGFYPWAWGSVQSAQLARSTGSCARTGQSWPSPCGPEPASLSTLSCWPGGGFHPDGRNGCARRVCPCQWPCPRPHRCGPR